MVSRIRITSFTILVIALGWLRAGQTTDPSITPISSPPTSVPPTSITLASPTPTATPTATATRAPAPTPTPPRSIRFAVIGDYGDAGQPEIDVANRVKSWNPDFIITTGDNNYPDGAANTIDANIGQYYREFISPYTGSYGAGAPTNRFFPLPGNHDWNTPDLQPYLDYFTLPATNAIMISCGAPCTSSSSIATGGSLMETQAPPPRASGCKLNLLPRPRRGM
jgi:hypothetical protein